MKRSIAASLPLFDKPQGQLGLVVETNGAREIQRLRVARLLGELARGLSINNAADERTRKGKQQ